MQYIKSTFNYGLDIDSKIFYPGKHLNLLRKTDYNIYVTPINFDIVADKQKDYIKLLKKAVNTYSEILDNKIKFHIIDTPQSVDIKIYWKRLNMKSAAVQFKEYSCGSCGIETLCVNIGVTDVHDKVLKDEEVYHLFLHEFGHIMCLGHSPVVSDVMCGGGDWNTELTPNDIFVLKLIYKIGSGYSYQDKEDYIKSEVKKFCKTSEYNKGVKLEKKNLLEDLTSIGELKLYTNTISRSINVDYNKNFLKQRFFKILKNQNEIKQSY